MADLVKQLAIGTYLDTSCCFLIEVFQIRVGSDPNRLSHSVALEHSRLVRRGAAVGYVVALLLMVAFGCLLRGLEVQVRVNEGLHQLLVRLLVIGFAVALSGVDADATTFHSRLEVAIGGVDHGLLLRWLEATPTTRYLHGQ